VFKYRLKYKTNARKTRRDTGNYSFQFFQSVHNKFQVDFKKSSNCLQNAHQWASYKT